MWRAATLLCVACLNSRKTHANFDLDVDDSFSASKHHQGAQIAEWLSNADLVLPELERPAEDFSQHIIISYAGGYNYETIKPFIVGILANCASADLVLLVPEGSNIPGLPEELWGRVHLQHHALPDVDDPDLLPHPVSLRFYVATAFLRKLTAAGHRGHVFLSDSRDVFVQRNMFVEPFLDDLLHFPRESGAYRLRGPFSLNADWVTQCYGRTTLSALGGFYVMNSGTLLGPSYQMLQYFDIMLAEFSKRWHCRRLHGSDQAIHNYLLYTGKLVGSGLEFQVEEMETGRFASVAWTHGAMLDFVDVGGSKKELQNRMGEPYITIHLWGPGDPESRVANEVVLPFVEEYEPQLLQ